MRAIGNIILSTANFDGDAALLVDGVAVPVRVRRSARARAYRLSLDAARGELRLSLPARVPLKKALAWAQGHEDWVRAQMAQSSRKRKSTTSSACAEHRRVTAVRRARHPTGGSICW